MKNEKWFIDPKKPTEVYEQTGKRKGDIRFVAQFAYPEDAEKVVREARGNAT